MPLLTNSPIPPVELETIVVPMAGGQREVLTAAGAAEFSRRVFQLAQAAALERGEVLHECSCGCALPDGWHT